ncbi:MobF family relaxase [Micromonospora sp. WMMD718]|uniref:MobF family relaxase n=2 Tax=Micromonospora sp. WMMD718 TaxID=3016098 RepID=UPI002415F78C|nr:MobF family relaxase [Micromonospora sp. WMMD718]MDG4756221.1 MobF family relaxase [Micromonospora sp. WMMD718]
MTLHPLHGGDGYTYLTREVATADVRRSRGQEITDYYHADGNPPGTWAGRALPELGISGTVAEAQMRALFGEGLHPNADAMIEQLIDEGLSAKEAEQRVRLGRRPMRYEPVDTYQERVKQRYEAHQRMTGRAPTAGERTRLSRAMGAKMFAEQHGRRPRDAAELTKYIAQVAKPSPQAVTGFDLVFTPPKSVETLWALGDEATRRVVEQAHSSAWRTVLADAENTVIKTRAGRAGVAQLDATSGVIAATFDHYDSRTGDPNLHTHVAIANRVKTADGKWRTIDSRALHAAAVSMSEQYNAAVVHTVAERLGGTVVAVDHGRGRRPVYEIAGVPDTLRTLFSGRRASISTRTAELIDTYVRDHGHEPPAHIRHQLAQQATLETRPPKRQARSLAALRDEWRSRAVEAVGQRRVDQLLTDVRKAAEATRRGDAGGIIPDDHEQLARLARAAVSTIEQQRATWTRHHIDAEVRRQLSAAGLGARVELARTVTDLALRGESVRITAPTTAPTLPELTRADGESVFQHAQTVRYSSGRILAAEHRVVTAAKTTVIAPVSGEVFDTTLARMQAAPGARQLDAGQIDVARAFATDGRLVVAGIGPAGAGKTTATRVVARAVEAAGGRLIGLAPSARAAAVLSDELSVPAHTLHRWLHHRDKGSRGRAWQLRAGDVILVDEAGMAGTLTLDAIIADAHRAGAVVRLLGDPQQLGAPASGGMLRLVQREAGAVELDRIHRFDDPAEGAASLALRDGTDEAWRWYWSRDRIQHGDRDTMIDRVYEAWRTDVAAGETSLMVAPTNDDTRVLNDRARADRIAAGQVEPIGVTLHDGTQAGRGDLVVSRRNESRLRLFSGRDMVLNGDVWHVEQRHDDGSLSVRHDQHGGRIRLPARYVREDVELAYATTIHRTQGMTVDRVRVLLTGAASRVQAYVALTRGRLTNAAYVITAAGERVNEALDSIRRNVGAAVSATEELRESFATAEHLPELANQYRYVADIAAADRHRAAVRAALGNAGNHLLSSPTWSRVSAALARAERAGWSAPDMLDAAGITDLAGAQDPCVLLTHRIRATQQRVADQLTQAPPRPLAGVSDAALSRLRDRAASRLHDAETALAWVRHDATELPAPVRVRGHQHPAWPDRPHGMLSDVQLAEAHRASQAELDQTARRLAAARRLAREARTPDQAQAATRYRGEIEAQARADRAHAEQLAREQRLRATMRPDDRARETAQRENPGAPTTTDALNNARTTIHESVEKAVARVEQARTIVARIDTEAGWRRRLPTAVRTAEQHDREGHRPTAAPAVPDWLADTRHLISHDTSTWATHLEERRAHLAERLVDMAREVAAQQPEWAKPLGQRPDNDTTAALAWDRAAGLAAAYRQTHQVPEEDTRILGKQPRPDASPRHQAYEETKAAIEPVRATRARANRAAAANHAREELRRKLQRATEREPVAAGTVRQPDTNRETERRARREAEAQRANQMREDRERERRLAEQQRLAATQRREPPGPQRGAQI